MRVEDLIPIDSQESFYGKAKVIITDDFIQLQSYNTIVAQIDKHSNKLTVNGWYSATTARHINSFLAHYGYSPLSKSEMIKFN